MNYSVNTDLLIKYFSGLASPEEALRIDEWRKENPDHEIQFGELFASWTADHNYTSPDVATLWQQFEATGNQKQIPLKQKSRVLKWMPYAAVLVLLLGIGLWQTGKKAQDAVKVFTYREEVHEFELQQGAKVALRPGSLLKEEVSKENKLYILSGTALFDFKAKFPEFRLQLSSGVILKDIGTKFLVEGDAQSAKISVYDGAVQAWKGKNAIMVYKNEVLTYTASGFSKADLTGNFDYKDYSLKQVCDSVGTYFHTGMQIEDNLLAGRMLTLSGKDLSLDQVLEIITETLNIQYDTLAKDTIVFKSH